MNTEKFLNATTLPPSVKHNTIIQTFEDLKEGESFVLHNDHDPKPLYYQLSAMKGDTFTWDYLKEGPEAWEIRIAKKKQQTAKSSSDELFLDATQLAPQVKHATIFQTFEDLKEGESFVLHNDHDPKPLYYQLSAMKGDTFTWDYLKEGPESWEIRIAKKSSASQAANGPKEGETFLNATELAPQVKHATIIRTYMDLKQGESFILHNDHDPKPLYYQLSSMQSDTFTWDYLKQGPEVWEIRITKKGQTAPKTQTIKTKEAHGDEKFLDVTQLPPREKHPTIFRYFDDLKAGEAFIIHNDHDPKPLYYQLKGERGDIFNWEYLKEGPDVFEIRISKKQAQPSVKGTAEGETIGSLSAQDYRKAEVFKRLGIDFCCHGNRSLAEAAQEAGMTEDELRRSLDEASSAAASSAPSQDYNKWDLDFLADYIRQTHHRYVKETAEVLTGLSEKVARVHGDHHPELIELAADVKAMFEDFTNHMSKEESVLFPAIKQLVEMKNKGVKPQVTAGGIAAAIDKMEAEHDETAAFLRKFRQLTEDYTLPGDACNSYTYLFEKLKEFEDDTFRHVHLENNILFPKSVGLEEQITS